MVPITSVAIQRAQEQTLLRLYGRVEDFIDLKHHNDTQIIGYARFALFHSRWNQDDMLSIQTLAISFLEKNHWESD